MNRYKSIVGRIIRLITLKGHGAKHARDGFENWTGSSYYESYGPYY